MDIEKHNAHKKDHVNVRAVIGEWQEKHGIVVGGTRPNITVAVLACSGLVALWPDGLGATVTKR